MNILIFEDEIYNYHFLYEMLTKLLPQSDIRGPLASIAEGKRFFATNQERIDLIIADIQLNDGLSFVALSEAPADVPIIFTTAYDEYALKAFEYNSLSYLLKPIDEDELHIAIRKSQERLISDDHRKELFLNISNHNKYRERFIINTFKGEIVVHVSQIRYFVSEEKSTFIKMLDGSSHTIDLSLKAIEEQLNPNEFMRVNRKFIVPMQQIERFERGINGKETLILKGQNPPSITISRDSKQKVHDWIH